MDYIHLITPLVIFLWTLLVFIHSCMMSCFINHYHVEHNKDGGCDLHHPQLSDGVAF